MYLPGWPLQFHYRLRTQEVQPMHIVRLGPYQFFWISLTFTWWSPTLLVLLLCTLMWCCLLGGLYSCWAGVSCLFSSQWIVDHKFLFASFQRISFLLIISSSFLLSIASWSWDMRNCSLIHRYSAMSRLVLSLHSLYKMTRSLNECCIGLSIPYHHTNLLIFPILLTFFPISKP